MRRTRAALATLAFAATAGSLEAQNPATPPARPGGVPQPPAAPGEIRGVVQDENNMPVPRAAVAVRSRTDSSLVTGAIANEDGSFRIQGLRPGNYYLRITSIGFAPRFQDFAITPAAFQVAAGPVKMSRVAVALQSVAVQADRPTMTIEPDRNTYRAKEVAAAATNASDVLDNVPSVQVDIDGKVSLRGNENVVVQINGRPAPIRGTQLGAYLKQIPASIVERVEVIPNPSAKEDPEGMAGIINLVLKQNADLGLSGGFTAGSAMAGGRYNTSGNLGYQTGPWTLFSSYGYNHETRNIIGINDRLRLGLLGVPSSITEQDIDGLNSNYGHNFTTTVDYKLNNRDVLSNALTLNRRGFGDATLMAYTERSGDSAVLEQYNRWRDTHVRTWMVDYNLAFKRTIEPRKHELSAEARYHRMNDDDRTLLWRQVQGGSASRLDAEDNSTDAGTQQITAQVDYTRTLAAKTRLETGYRGNGRFLDRDFVALKDPLGTDRWVRSSLSNALEFEEKVHAIYGVLSHGIGKLELQGGLRGEYADRDFALANERTSYPFSYSSLFPSAIAMYKPSEQTQARFSYSRRIRRPGTQELNPFPVFFDAQNVFIGNPKLNPEYTDAIELNLSRSGALGQVQLAPFYRRTTDVMRFIINTADTVDGREVTSVSFQNLETANSWGTDLNGSLRLGKAFNGLASFNVYKMVTDGGSTSSLGSDAVMWTARLNGTLNVNPGLSVQTTYFYRSGQKVERGEFAPTQMMNIALRQKLMNDKATAILRFQDPFNTMKFRVVAGDENLTQITERSFGVRAVYLTVQYNFGQAPRIRQPRPEDQPQPTTPGFP